jgi:hypothetical protein
MDQQGCILTIVSVKFQQQCPRDGHAKKWLQYICVMSFDQAALIVYNNNICECDLLNCVIVYFSLYFNMFIS